MDSPTDETDIYDFASKLYILLRPLFLPRIGALLYPSVVLVCLTRSPCTL